jgi:hypothetical protein
MRILLAMVALAFAGCASPKMVNVKVESDPPGAHVFFGVGANEQFADTGRSFIGTTPFVWPYKAKPDGTFDLPGALIYSIMVPPVAKFTAEPPSGSTNLFIRSQVFHGGTIATAAYKVPEGIFFDLTKPK